jgi:hypothetical protein
MKKTVSMRSCRPIQSRILVFVLGMLVVSAATLLVAPVQVGFAADANATMGSEKAPASTELLAFEGTWKKVEDPKDEEDRVSAIDRAIRGLSWIVRKMATGVLNRTTAPALQLEFVWDGERLHQTLEGKDGPVVRPIEIDGESLDFEDDRGVPFTSNWTWIGDGLQVTWKQHQAYGSNVYRIDEESQTLRVEHMIQVTAISNIDPIIFYSRFNRSQSPSLSAATRNSGEVPATNFR